MLAEVIQPEEKIETQRQEAIDWSAAKCRQLKTDGQTVDLFFSEQLDDIRRAKAICGECELSEACLALALARRESWGIWGGQLFINGKVISQKRGRGRPPKNPDLQKTA